MIKNIYSLIFFLFVILNSCTSQNEKDKDIKLKIKTTAEQMTNSLVKKDYQTFIKFSHPKIIEMMGGKDIMLNTLNAGLPDGNEIRKVSILNVSDTLVVNNIIQCTLIEEIEMTVNGGILVFKSNLIGISYDQGNNWYFLDANNQIREQMKELFPELSNRLQLKIFGKPIFISN